MAKNGDRPQKVSALAETLGLNKNVLGKFLNFRRLIEGNHLF